MSKRAAKTNKTKKNQVQPLIGVVMGSQSDWETMQHAIGVLEEFNIPFEHSVISAHRMPQQFYAYATSAAARGLKVMIGGAGGAAHLPGMMAALTILPVFGVPIESKALNGLDSLLSIVQMPAGVPVGTLAVGKAGAMNAALLAVAVLALHDKALAQKLRARRAAIAASLSPGSKTAKKRKASKR
jgi:5-(carboxyamino)imidazole ribonucleotide mutase